MATNLVPFNKTAVPAYITKLFGQVDNTALAAAQGAIGGPRISFRGKVWRIIADGQEQVYNAPGTDEPAQSLEVVIVKANPRLSKLYYAGKYVEGSDNPPLCSSKDGITPDEGVEAKQSDSCASCPHNAWGSRISEQGKKAKECSDSRRLVVLPAGDLNFPPLLLSIPSMSLAERDAEVRRVNASKDWYSLSDYATFLDTCGTTYSAVVTKIGFDPRVAYPKLLFKTVRWLDETEAKKVAALVNTREVSDIVGITKTIPAISTLPNTEVPKEVATNIQKPVAKAKAKPVVSRVQDIRMPDDDVPSTEQDVPAGLSDEVGNILAGLDD